MMERVNSSSQRDALHLTGLRVLVIEDTQDARLMFCRIIRRAGAEVQTADSIKEAWQVLSVFSPDVIVSDIGLPDEDGISFIKKFRRVEGLKGSHTPTVAVTAFSHLRELVMSAGFDVFLAKPTTGVQLISRIDEALRSTSKH